MNNIIKRYEEYLEKELNYSANTIKSYLSDLNDYQLYLEDYNIKYLKINRNNIRDYLKILDDNKLTNKTISRKLTSLRMFYEYLLDIKLINNNIFNNISNPKIEKNLPHYLNYNEIDDLINNLPNESIFDIRNKLIIELLYSTGIRLDEITNLMLKNINKSDKIIKVVGKGNKEREVYFGTDAYNSLNEYLNNARSELLNNKTSEYLFINRFGNKLGSSSIYKVVRDSIKYISSKRKISPHTLRHTFATHLLNNGADIKSVQALLGHENINTTEIYTHVSNKEIKDIYLKTHPRKGIDYEE